MTATVRVLRGPGRHPVAEVRYRDRVRIDDRVWSLGSPPTRRPGARADPRRRQRRHLGGVPRPAGPRRRRRGGAHGGRRHGRTPPPRPPRCSTRMTAPLGAVACSPRRPGARRALSAASGARAGSRPRRGPSRPEQLALAASACSWKAARSMLGTSAEVVRSMRLIRNPPSPGTRWTLAVVSTDLGVKRPPPARRTGPSRSSRRAWRRSVPRGWYRCPPRSGTRTSTGPRRPRFPGAWCRCHAETRPASGR